MDTLGETTEFQCDDAAQPAADGTFSGAHDAHLGLPARLGRYVPLGLLGAGGMGQVYAAFDTELARRVAIKVLARGSGRTPINAEPRLRREARALARLAHPNVVAIYDVGEADGTVFVAMEHIDGQTLGQWQRRSPRPWPEIVDAYLQAGRGLAGAHAQGLVHRDFKPDNAIIDDDGRVQVLDFGLAVAAAGPPPTSASADSEPGDDPAVLTRLTITGSVLGTPAYMAPEQLDGSAADARSDQFSYCVALFEALFGERPFEAETIEQLRAAIRSGEIRTPRSSPRVPAWLRRVLVRGLAPDPAQRWPTMAALLAALSRGRRGLARRGAAVLGVGLVGTLVATSMAPQAAVFDPCATASNAIEQAWGAHNRAAVRGAIAESGLPYGADAWARVGPGLDGYAHDWSEQRHATCEAGRAMPTDTTIAHEIACLDGQRAEFSALIELLSSADARLASRAAAAVAQLPRPTDCRHTTATEADPEVVAELRAALGRAHALQLAGDYAGSRDTAQPVVERAQSLNEPLLLAEALLHLGIAHERAAQYAEAERVLSRATMLGVEHGLDAIAAEASVELTGVVGYELARFEDGLAWARHAEAAVTRARAEPPLRSRLSNNIGATHDRHGDLEAARTHYAAGLTALDAAQGDRAEQLRTSSLNNLGNAEARLGHVHDARRHLSDAVQRIEALRGAAHPEVAIMVLNLGNLELDHGDLDLSVQHYRRAVQIASAALGAEHPIVASSRLNLGLALQIAGKPGQAKAVLKRAVQQLEDTVGPDHHRTGVALNNLGEALRDLGDPEGALALHRRTLSIWTHVHGPSHVVLAYAENNIGLALLANGEHDEAVEQLQRALDRRTEHNADPAVTGCSRLGLARALRARAEAQHRSNDAERDPSVQPQLRRADALVAQATQELKGANGRFRREQEQLRQWNRAANLATADGDSPALASDDRPRPSPAG